MSVTSRVAQTARNTDPDALKEIAQTGSQAIQDFQDIQSQIQDDDRDAEQTIQQGFNLAEDIGEGIELVFDEIEDAEDKGSKEELEDAEQKEESLEEETEELEKDIDRAEKDEMEEINLEEKQEELIIQLEKEAESILEDANEKLEKEFSHLKKAANEQTAEKLDAGEEQRLEQILEEYKNGIRLINQATWMIEQLSKEILETEKEENQVEKLSAELSKDFNFMEREVAELEQDYEKLHDKKHAKLAQQGADELQKEEQHGQQEIKREKKIDAEMKNEIETLEEIIDNDRNNLLQLVNQSIKELRKVYQGLRRDAMIQQWQFSLNKKPPLDEIENTINVLQSGLKKDEEAIKQESQLESKIKSGLSSLSPSKKSAVNAGKKTSKYVLIGSAVILTALIAYALLPGAI